MVKKGISLYPGLGYPLDLSFQYLELAQKNGFSRLFTSLHIPEANPQNIVFEFKQLVAAAARLGFEITADISPAGFEFLEAGVHNLQPLRKMGLTALRLDFGFDAAQIAALSKKGGLNLELNASTIDENTFHKIMVCGADLKNIEACHNYYPRPETGLSWELFQKRSDFFRARGIKVAAFIASLANRRGPLGEGLPTLEEHRRLKPLNAAKHLFYAGVVDEVRFGDPLAQAEEIISVGALDENCVELKTDLFDCLSTSEKEILFFTHTNRYDPGEWTIRSAEARSLAVSVVLPRPPFQRNRGSVTIDNVKYCRYMGELQIVKKDFPVDERVNVVAKVIDEELFLLDFIAPGGKFRFAAEKKGGGLA